MSSSVVIARFSATGAWLLLGVEFTVTFTVAI